METLRCGRGLGAEHRHHRCTQVCPAHNQWREPAVVMDGQWNAAANRLTNLAQLAVSSKPGEPTISSGGYDRKPFLSDRPIGGSQSLCEETGSYPGLSFFALQPRRSATIDRPHPVVI